MSYDKAGILCLKIILFRQAKAVYFMNIDLLRKNVAFSATPEIIDICKPLLRFGINYFSFMRIYPNKSHIRFCTHADWSEYYYTKDYYDLAFDVPDTTGIIPWLCLPHLQSLQDAAEFYDIANGVMLTLQSGDTIEIYSIGANKENRGVNHFYLNQTDLLYRFILYFKEKAFPLIKKAQKNPIFFPNPSTSNKDKTIDSDLSRQLFLDDIELKNVSVTIDSDDLLLVKKEAQILALMKCGFSAKEIAARLDIKLRTVEVYLKTIREKLLQFTTNCLLHKIDNNPLINKRWLLE